MIMSALAGIEMSSSLVDCRLSERGRDGPRGHGDDKSQGVAASPCDRQVREKRITQREADTLLGLPDRQIRSLLRCVEQEGDQGLVHRGRGTPSNRRMAEPAKAQMLRLYESHYGDFGPTLAVEKLAEQHGLTVSAVLWLRRDDSGAGQLPALYSAGWSPVGHLCGQAYDVSVVR
ncbi:MAG TPA: hypothetical protein VLE46_17225 [Nitrospira sp.]|nr:hypothetical protein [Nitrospira sp.]